MKTLNPEFTQLAQAHDSNLDSSDAPVPEVPVKLVVRVSREQEVPLPIALKHQRHVMRLNSFRAFGINE